MHLTKYYKRKEIWKRICWFSSRVEGEKKNLESLKLERLKDNNCFSSPINKEKQSCLQERQLRSSLRTPPTKARTGKISKWIKIPTAVKERGQEELVKEDLRVQRHSKEGLSRRTKVLDPKLSVGVALHLVGMDLH